MRAQEKRTTASVVYLRHLKTAINAARSYLHTRPVGESVGPINILVAVLARVVFKGRNVRGECARREECDEQGGEERLQAMHFGVFVLYQSLEVWRSDL